jgi:hypothetical protein
MNKHTSTSQVQNKPDGVREAGISTADLYLKTFDELKKEIAASVKDARDTERNTLLLCGGIIAYISGNCGAPAIVVARYLPLLLAVFGAIRVLVLMISVNPRAQYLKALEKDTFSGRPLPGWEEFFRNHYRRGVGASMIIFWTILVAGTAALPHFLTVSECKSH